MTFNARLPRKNLQDRRSVLVQSASELGCDLTLIFGFGSALGGGSKSHGAVRYLCDWDSHESQSLLVLSPTQAFLLVASPFMVPAARNVEPEIQVIDRRPGEWAAFLEPLTAGLERIATIGFEEMPMSVFADLKAVLDRPISVTLDDKLGEMRVIKDQDALALHAAGAEICDTLFASLREELHKGQTCWRIQLALETKARELGADYCRTWLTAAPIADYPRYWPEEGEHVPRDGDQVLFGIALTYAGHWAHGIRMGSIGTPTALQMSFYSKVHDMLERGLALLIPGHSVAECETAMNAVLDTHYSGEEIANMIRFRNGHGLGTSYEDPVLTPCFPQYFGTSGPIDLPTDKVIIQPSMLFEIHPNFFVPDVAGGVIGEMVVTTTDGPVCLLKHPREFAVY